MKVYTYREQAKNMIWFILVLNCWKKNNSNKNRREYYVRNVRGLEFCKGDDLRECRGSVIMEWSKIYSLYCTYDVHDLWSACENEVLLKRVLSYADLIYITLKKI